MTAPALAAMIEARLSAIDETRPSGFSGNREAWTAYYAKGRELMDELVRGYNARYRFSGGTHHLKLAGFACSCTSGELALLRAWAAKVRRLTT